MPDAAVHAPDIADLLAGRRAVVVRRDELVVDGPDAVSYLQGQLSQDVAALDVGGSALTFLLEPQGRVVALGRIHRTAAEAVVLDVDAGVGEAALARLLRFRLRTRADIALAESVPYLAFAGAPHAGGSVVSTVPGTGYDLAHQAGVDAPLLPHAAFEAVRARAGVPAAVDLDERTVPAETGLVDASASFTKGCYTGQELVARMDARVAEPPRRIRRVTGAGAAPTVGAVVHVDEREAGRLTTVAAVDGSWVGLALVPRAVHGGPASVAGGDGQAVSCVVEG